MPATRFFDRGVNPPNQALLPLGERERLAGEAAFVQTKFLAEPDGLIGPAQRIRDGVVGP
jgi:hypothetical protein